MIPPIGSSRRPSPDISAAVIVAHPDDETLWPGGMILAHPDWQWFILGLCRANDADRAPKFWRALDQMNAMGNLADLDDGPEQKPLSDSIIRQTIISFLPHTKFDIILTHSPEGEYTRHLRHEEVSRAVVDLWNKQEISTKKLLMFAYEDGGKK